jgi:hypothetical protein
MAEKTPANHLEPFKWAKGQSGNPAGKPKGARTKLGEAFIEALHDDFNEHGIAAIQVVRAEKPDQYLKVIASLMPKEHRLSVNDQFADMTDDELAQRIRQLAETIAPFLDSGTGCTDEAVGGATGPQFPAGVH